MINIDIEKKNQFLELIINEKNKTNPSRLKESWFYTYGHKELWNWFSFIKETIFNNIYSNKELVFLLRNNVHEIPKCIVCGKPPKVIMCGKYEDYHYDYCSLQCANKSKVRNEKISLKKSQNFKQVKETEIKSIKQFSINDVFSNEEIFKEFVNEFLLSLKNISGKFQSTRLNQRYFDRQNKSNYWEIFLRIKKDIFLSFYDNKDVLFMLNNNIFEIPRCMVCGKPAKIQQYEKTYNYCSKSCSSISPIRIQKLVESKKLQDHEVSNEKRKQTMLEKYGYETNSKRPEIKEKLGIHRIDLPEDEIINEYLTGNVSIVSLSKKYNVSNDVIRYRLQERNIPIIQNFNVSGEENEVKDFIISLGFDVIQTDYSLIGKEIDLVIKDTNILIEMNGNFFHSSYSLEDERKRNLKFKHLQKTKLCEEKGYNLFHIRGDQWIFKTEIIKSMLRHKLNKTPNKIYARKCIIKEISVIEKDNFLEVNHLQGKDNSKYRYGLYYNNSLVSVMTFSKPRFNTKYDYELIRFATKLNTNVIGGFSKLLKYFRNNYKGSIISYADRTHSTGNLYKSNGFSFSHETEVGYFYTDRRYNVYNRIQFQKHKLKNKLEIYDENLSEVENMFNNGYRRMWDCGNLVFVLE